MERPTRTPSRYRPTIEPMEAPKPRLADTTLAKAFLDHIEEKKQKARRLQG